MSKIANPEQTLRVRSINGFSLIELVIVIAVIGILSVMVVPRWQGMSTNLEFEMRKILTDIRYTQLLSMTTGKRYRWVKTSANTYQIVDETGAAIALPTGGTQSTLVTGATFGTFTNLPSNLVVFNSQGIPYTDTATPGTALTSAATISVTAGGQTRSVQISPQTGYGQVQ